MKLLSTLLGLSLAQNEEERSLFGTEEINFDEQNRFLQEQRFAEEIKGLISGSLSCIAEDARIIGGNEADKLTWRWIAFLHKNNCGGTVLNSRMVATAGHCCTWDFNRYPEKYEMAIGRHYREENAPRNIAGPYSRIYEAEKVVQHPDVNFWTFENDMCLIFTKEEIEFNPGVAPACTAEESPKLGKLCYIAGWGAQSTDGSSASEVLNEAEVEILDSETCFHNIQTKLREVSPSHSNFVVPDSWHETMMCAGNWAGGVDSCQGDSGGPLVCIEDNRPILHGVVSWGMQCALPGLPGVYMRVSNYSDWIAAEYEKFVNGDTDSSDICDPGQIYFDDVKGFGSWDCTDEMICEWVCNDGGRTGVVTTCDAGDWSKPSKSSLKGGDCRKCHDADRPPPAVGATWDCSGSGSRKTCHLVCDGSKNGQSTSCDRKNSAGWSDVNASCSQPSEGENTTPSVPLDLELLGDGTFEKEAKKKNWQGHLQFKTKFDERKNKATAYLLCEDGETEIKKIKIDCTKKVKIHKKTGVETSSLKCKAKPYAQKHVDKAC